MNKKLLIVSLLLFLGGCQYLNPPSGTTGTQQPLLKEAAPETQVQTGEKQPMQTGVLKINENFRASVVYVACTTNSDEGTTVGGTGILFDPAGLIITSAQLIPQDKENLTIITEPAGCTVNLTDPDTGILQNETYLARPIVVKDLSKKYDLATLKIYDMTSISKSKKPISLPVAFPTTDIKNACTIDSLKLEDKIRIYGYQDVGSESSPIGFLDGVVSAFDNGIIFTTAKMAKDNRGGLALNADGCFIGIPVGEASGYASLISTDLINKFLKEAENNNDILPQGTAVVTQNVAGESNIYLDKDTNLWVKKGDKDVQLTFNAGQLNLCKNGPLTYSDPEISDDLNYVVITSNCTGEISEIYIKDTNSTKLGLLLATGQKAHFVNGSKIIKIDDDFQVDNPFLSPNAPGGNTVTKKSASFVRIDQITDYPDEKGRFIVSGSVSSDCTKIEVLLVNKNLGKKDRHTLTEWKSGEATFFYRVGGDLNNGFLGLNDVTVTATCPGGTATATGSLWYWE